MMVPRTAGFAAASVALGSALILIAALFAYQALFSHPGKAEAAATVIYLTSGSSWSVPSDWNSANNTIEVIGGGAGGGPSLAGSPANGNGGGGGGAYAKISNLSLTALANVTYAIGSAGNAPGGTGGDTYFNGASLGASSVGAKGGSGASASTGGAGGAAASSVGTVKYSGGSGGNGSAGAGCCGGAGGGGGGAAGLNGNGIAGAAGVSTSGGAGGRGDANLGGVGGTGASGGSGPGGTGGNGAEWTTNGSGGGGGGGAGNAAGLSGFAGGIAGSYGGGGGGGGGAGSGGPASGSGNSGRQGIIVITYTPVSPPGTPGTPTFASISDTTLTVNWTAASGASTYTVQRCIGSTCSSFATVGSSIAGLSYNDSLLTASTTYRYRVYATNAGGNGPNSGIGTVSTLRSAPGTPTFSTITQTSMRVNWTPVSGALSYKLERCLGAGCSSFTQLASGIGALIYDDSGLTIGTSYSYRVRATFAGGDGAYSGTGTQVTTGGVPGAPGTPSFSSVTASGMSVTWTVASGAATYKVERCTGAGCSNFAQVAGGLNTPLFTDVGLNPGTSYTYRARGTNAQGDGAYSSSATQVTTSSGAGSTISFTGWAWSDTIGWISLTCDHTSDGTAAPDNVNTCGSVNYGLAIDPGSGAVSGYAWSENVGWITANASQLGGCPSGTCSATLTTSALIGWLRVCSGMSNTTLNQTTPNNACTNGAGTRTDGFDGFIALSDTNVGDGISYGVTYSGGNFGLCDNTVGNVNCAWGSSVVGWVDFSRAHATFNVCSPSTTYSCSNTTVIRRTVQTGSCVTTITDPYLTCAAPQFCSVGSPTCLTPPADGFTSGGLTGHLLARPNLVARTGTTTVYWGVYNVQPSSCTVTTDDGSSAWSGPFSATSTCPTKYGTGCTSLPINRQTTFRLSCLDFDGNNYVETAIVNLLPEFQER